ncbi:hypothetical protein CASFOL_027129 [Castilleja foliolosa]|uniref:Uncharacterized protein n=1 Tax=Castilleja foliolosa TaxID=1961234 RepID=A0ABD3CGN9_9LAMI
MVFVCVGCEAVMQRSAVVHDDGQQVFSFAEAVSLYDTTISIDPSKASYRSNKRAALTALGSFSRQRLNVGKLFASTSFTNGLTTDWLLFMSVDRLGEPGKATYHFKQAGSDADPDAMKKAKKVEFHLEKCSEAKRQQYWNILIKETIVSTAAGADSAPLELLVVHAQVDMIEGRFDDVVAAAERALILDAKNREANGVLRRTKAYIRCVQSDYGLYNVTEPPIDALRDPLFKSDREIQVFLTKHYRNSRLGNPEFVLDFEGKQKRNGSQYDERQSKKVAQELHSDMSDDELLCSLLAITRKI